MVKNVRRMDLNRWATVGLIFRLFLCPFYCFQSVLRMKCKSVFPFIFFHLLILSNHANIACSSNYTKARINDRFIRACRIQLISLIISA